MPKIDVTALPFVARGGYPPPHDKLVAGRSRKRLGDEAGLIQFGVNLTKLTPGAFSSAAPLARDPRRVRLSH